MTAVRKRAGGVRGGGSLPLEIDHAKTEALTINISSRVEHGQSKTRIHVPSKEGIGGLRQ